MDAISTWLSEQSSTIIVAVCCYIGLIFLHFKDMKQIRKMAEVSIAEVREAYSDSNKKTMEMIERLYKKLGTGKK